MKKIITLLLLPAALAGYAQPKLLTQATITTKTTIVAPEEDESAPVTTSTSNGDEVRIMRFGGDGETKTTTWLKNDWIKTFSESEMGRTTVIRDNSKKITTTIMEMMGKKTGFYATDEDQEVMRKRMDSMMQGRNPNGANIDRTAPTINIVYVDENKKIAGYDCKKALIISTRANGKADTTSVWYCPDFKIQGLSSIRSGIAGFGSFAPQSGTRGMENLNGFPMQYESKMARGRKMTVQVTKLVIDKEIADKEFEIPKDVEVKAMKDMQNGAPGSGTIQFRAGN